ncbi:hypothetical protein IL306_006919 [Fusarium sp. DS 682]|nr:hypothetical protein IL306_006919 [Fusarium sp. DS 682]
MADNNLADKNITNDKVVHDRMTDPKSTDDKMKDEKTTQDKSTDNEMTSLMTSLNIDEKTKDEMANDKVAADKHNDGDTAEDEIASLSEIRKSLFPHMSDKHFQVVTKWLQTFALKFDSEGENTAHDIETKNDPMSYRFACIRLRCVACRQPCEDEETRNPVDGHSAYNFKEHGKSPICP